MSEKKTIKVFTRPGCVYCPATKKLVEQINKETGERFEIQEVATNTSTGFAEAKARGIFSLPTVTLGAHVVWRGFVGSKEKLRDAINQASAQGHRH